MTGRLLDLHSPRDGFTFGAIQVPARRPRRGGVVLLHEIFGLDHFVKADAARFAAAGYDVVAPSLFDRGARGFVGERNSAGITRGLEMVQVTEVSLAMSDIAASLAALPDRSARYLVGYCYGARLAWQAAAEIETIAAAACYYGQIAGLAHLAPRCPVICHFGLKDPHIDAHATRHTILTARPEVAFHLYERSGHGFNNAGTPDSHPGDAKLARRRTRSFFAHYADRVIHLEGAPQA